MDYYRLLNPISTDCEGRNHVRNVVECAYPPIEVGETADRLFEDVGRRADKTFFSQRKLREHFGEDDIIRSLLGCGCQQCKDQRGESPLDALRYQRYIHDKDAWMLLPIMVYLGKLHFIYTWLDTIDARTRAPVQCSNVAPLESLLPDDLQRKLFISAYERVLKMFNPFVFTIDNSGTVPPKRVVPHERFPFQNEQKPSRQGQFGTLLYFEVSDEYVDRSVAFRMDQAYKSSIAGTGNAKTYRFARKILKADPADGMEKDMLQLVSQIKGQASDNIITLLALYYWGKCVHYVFPFVETSLYSVLREGHFREELSPGPLRLPDHWLWVQMVGVARALSAIHTGIDNPFSEDEGKVIAFHFDLKPDNILVTADRQLKITDFGQSIIQIVDTDEERSAPLKQGDIKYNAPESRLNSLDIRHNSSGEPRDIQVLLNYDVWSLACIMVEVLILLLDERRHTKSTELDVFDKELQDEKPEVVFFGDNVVKDCVNRKVLSIGDRLVNIHPTDQVNKDYVMAVCKLIIQMFTHNKDHRPQSDSVLKCLEETHDTYQLAWQLRGDKLRTSIRRKELAMEGPGRFKEIGWCNEDKVVSFLEMGEVSVKLHRTDRRELDPPESCRIQLLYKAEEVRPAPKSAHFILKWGFEKPNQEPTVRGCIIDTAFAQLIPTYIYQDEPDEDHQCTLFNGIRKIGNGLEIVITLGFQSRGDAEAFQGAILHHKVINDFGEPIVAEASSWTERSTSIWLGKEGEPSTMARSQIQFWAKEKPNYYKQPETQITKPVANNIRRASLTSTHSNNSPRSVESAAMALFGPDRSLVLLPLNIGDKLFSLESDRQVTISNNSSNKHKSFRTLPTPLYNPWDNGESEFACPNIPLEEMLFEMRNEGRKLKRASITLAKSRDMALFKRAAVHEWSA
ncbi:serine/threonine protein kinase [Ilyonectria robusta]